MIERDDVATIAADIATQLRELRADVAAAEADADALQVALDHAEADIAEATALLRDVARGVSTIDRITAWLHAHSTK